MDRRSEFKSFWRVSGAACSCLAMFVWLVVGAAGGVAAAEEAKKEPGPAPVRLDRDKLAGLGLVEYEPFPAEIVLEGRSKHRSHVLFMGDEIVAEVYEAEPAKLAVSDPFPYDEFVYILSGKLILTDRRGKVQEYAAGEYLVVPKGFTGTWHMLGNYRELVVIEKRAYRRVEEAE